LSLTIHFGSIPKQLKSMSCENSVEDGLMGDKDVDSDAPSLPPKKKYSDSFVICWGWWACLGR